MTGNKKSSPSLHDSFDLWKYQKDQYKQSIKNRIAREEREQARLRREGDLADEQRRNKDVKLDIRLADILNNSEYRPKSYNEDPSEETKLEKIQKEVLDKQQEVISHNPNPNPADPEVPQYLRDPRDQPSDFTKPLYEQYFKSAPSFVPMKTTTSVADDGSTITYKEPIDFLNVPSKQEILTSIANAAETAYSVADKDLNDAQQELQSAINESDQNPEHGSYWGDVLMNLLSPRAIPGLRLAQNVLFPKLTAWEKNAIGKGAIQKNELEVGADANEINRSVERIARGNEMRRYAENVQQIIDYEDKLAQLQQLPKTSQTSALIRDVASRISELKLENEKSLKSVQDAATYFPGADEEQVAMYSGMGWASPNSNSAKASIDAINRLVTDKGYGTLSQEQRQAIKKYTQNIDDVVSKEEQKFNEERPKLLRRMADNIREMKSWMNSEFNPSEEFNKRADAATSFDFTDPDTYVYGMPGLIGSSMSFGGWQLANTALGLAVMGGTVAGTGGMALPVVGGLATTGLGVISGHYENNSEGYENYKEALIKKLTRKGMYDQWIEDGKKALGKKDATEDDILYAMAAGIYEPKEKIKGIAAQATYGLNNLYKDDMTAVVGNELFEAGLNFLGPVSKLMRASKVTPGAKIARARRLATYMAEHPSQAKLIKASNDVYGAIKESTVGSALASSIAFPLAPIGAAVEAGIKKAIPTKAVHALLNRFALSADIMERIPATVLGGKAIGKNLLEYAGKVLGSSWSESIEEGKQYINGKKFQDGSYAGASDTLMDSILNDIAGGSRAAYSFVGDMFGVRTDKELISNMKGGFLGGFGHTAMISGVNAVANTVMDLRASDYVTRNVLAMKAADRTDIANNSYLGTQTSPTQYERIMNAFDAMENIASRAEEKNGGVDGLNFTVEDVKEQRKAYENVFNFANQTKVQEAARALDITPGTDKFGTFVGLAMWAKGITNDAVKNLIDTDIKGERLISAFISNNSEEERSLKDIIDDMSYEDLMKLNEEWNLIDTSQFNTTNTGLGSYNTALANAIRAAVPNIRNQISSIATMDALFTLRDQLEMIENPTSADKRRLRSVNRQIKNLQKTLPNTLKDITTAQELEKFVLDTKLHEVLRDLYRDSANFITDIQEGAAIQYMLLGGKVAGIDFMTSKEKMQAFQYAQEDIKDRKKAALDLIEQYEQSIGSDEELQQAIHDTFEQQVVQEEQPEIDVEEVQPQPEPENVPVEPVQSPSEPASPAEPTVIPEEPETKPTEPVIAPDGAQLADVDSEEDLDEQIKQIEAEYSPGQNTMLTRDDLNVDFDMADDDWNKVSDSTKELANKFVRKVNAFLDKWVGKPATRAQFNGIRGNVVKFQRELETIKERIKQDILEYGNTILQPEGPVHEPTPDEILDLLNEEDVFRNRVYYDFAENVAYLDMYWRHWMEAKNETNERLFRQALSNCIALLNVAEDFGIQLNEGDTQQYTTDSQEIQEWDSLHDNVLPPPPPAPLPPTPARQRFERPWAQYTTTHTHSADNAGYNIEDSVATDGSGVKLSEVTGNPDFVENSIIWFTTRLTRRGSKKITMNVMYGGHQFSPVDIHTADDISGKGKAWYKSVLSMLNAAAGRFVMPQKAAIRRSNGIIGDAPSLQTFEQMGFLDDDNMYSIEYSSSQDTFCVVKYEKGEFGQPVAKAYIPGQEGGRSQHEVYSYAESRPGSTLPAEGGIVMMVHPPYPELDASVRVPINCMYTPLTDGDAQLIVDLLSGEYREDPLDYGARALETQEFTENGIKKGLTRAQVLRMLIRYKGVQERYNPHQLQQRYIEYDRNDQRYVILHGNFGEGVKIPYDGRFNIQVEAEKNALRDFLKQHHNRAFPYMEFLQCRINGNTESLKHPLHGLGQFRAGVGSQIFRNGGKLTFGNSSIVFDEKDFGNAENPEGVSGIVWAMRRGWLQTPFESFSNPLINFDEDIPLVYNTDQPAAPAKKQEPAPEAPKEQPHVQVVDFGVNPEDEYINYDPSDPMVGSRSTEKLNVEEARKFIEKVLGEKLDDGAINDRLNEIAKQETGTVLGLLHWSGKILFDPYAPQDTVYHEVFHKVVELLLGDRTRKMLYKTYAKKMHISYKDDEDLLSNKDIREGLAEEFRYYMDNRPTLKLGSILRSFKNLKQFAQFMHSIGDYRLYLFYSLTRRGIIKHLFSESSEKHTRFFKTHGAFAPFSINGHTFENIVNRYQYRVLRNTLIYLIFRTSNVDVDGSNVQNLRISKQAILRDKKYQQMVNSNARGANALQELVENIEVIENDLKAYLVKTYQLNINKEDEDVEDLEGGEDAIAMSLGTMLKYSDEVSQFSRAGARVKFALSRIPKVRFYYKFGKRAVQYIYNDEDLIEYFDVKYVFNTVVNQCHDCRNAEELLNRLKTLAKDNAMFDYMYNQIVLPMYNKAQEGNADAEASFAQLLISLHAAKGEYVVGKARRSQNGKWSIVIQNEDSDYNAREYKAIWSQLFANGSEYLEKTTEGYKMKLRKGTQRRYSPEVFRNIYLFLTSVRNAVISGNTVSIPIINEAGKVELVSRDVTKEDEFDHVKDEFCKTLQKLGIQFNKDELNYTLMTAYGSSDFTAMAKMLERNDTASIMPFLNWLNGCYNPVTKDLNITQAGTLNGKPIESAVGSFGFVGMLANAKYKYSHDHDQLSVLATKGNRYYVISENNLITDITDDINASLNGDNSLIGELKSFHYNWIEENGTKKGSLILKNLANNKKISVVTAVGFKTDEKGDQGQDYAEISPAEDYITKAQILMQGGLIFPTMSDKKTWVFLKGVEIPGLQFLSRFINLGNGKYELSQSNDVLNQLLEYAKCELRSIEDCLRSVRGYTDADGVYHAPLQESEKIANYHKRKIKYGKNGDRVVNVIQGGRFGVLTGIIDDDGNFVSFNRIHEQGSEVYKNEDENYYTALEYFFGVPDGQHPGMYFVKTKANDKDWSSGRYMNAQQLQDHQYKLLSRLLQKQMERELQYAESLGLIEKVTDDKNVPVVLRYRNKLLDSQWIDAIAKDVTDVTDQQQKESLAISIFLNRVSAASNISLQEVERVYAGHPAFFKWSYNKNGELSDRSSDQHKRLGGLVSTGSNNVLDIPSIPDEYTCAEINNDEVGSSISKEMYDQIMDSELRSIYLRQLLESKGVSMKAAYSKEAKQIVDEVDAMSLDEIKKKLEEQNPTLYKTIISSADKKAKSFVKGIDVADGAAYITDEMAEWLLRMVGSWNSKVERAFKILRGQEVDGKIYTTKDILTLQKAYQDVLTTVIGNQKYTAYGFRFFNNTAIPYYDKMALFPMFKCISTGTTAKIFDKMKKEGVDMLLINSAVKVGSQGSKDMNTYGLRVDNDPTNEDNFVDGDVGSQNWKPSYDDFHFNKYTQKFKYLRKQFNTDPSGKEIMHMGTQTTKVAMAGVIPGRNYLIVDGVDKKGNKIYRTMSANDIRDDIMDCMNKMSDLGEKKVRERFINKDGTVNIRELSKFLREELSSRGASQEAIEAVSLSLDGEDGSYSMHIPPVAQANMEWLQSIIVSMINKNVIDINTPGAPFIQRSVWGMEGSTTVLGAEDLPGDIYEGRELQMVNEEGTMDCVLSIDYFSDIIPQDVVRDQEGHVVYEKDDEGNYITREVEDENGNKISKRVVKMQPKSFKDARQWLIDNNIISGRKSDGTWSNARANIIGSRIPTQAPSSIHALRCVDVLPVVRDTVVLPKEFTKITGADFDIDKLYLSRLYYKVEAGKAITDFKYGTYEYYANRLINDYIALLKDSKSRDEENKNRTANSNHGPIDGDTELLTSIVSDLFGSDTQDQLDVFTPYSLWANAQTKTEFITGKFGIGPFALNNNSQILTMLYNVAFKSDGFLGFLGQYRLDRAYDRYGTSILSWLSGLINAHVDVAKDPYISRLNVNSYTYNLINLMIRTGFGKDTFYFTTQPIMIELARVYNNAASQYGSSSSRSKAKRQKDAVEKAAFDLFQKGFTLPKDVTTLKDAMRVINGHFKKTVGIDVDSAISLLLAKDCPILHEISKKKIPATGRAKLFEIKPGLKLSAAEVQYLVYVAKTKFKPYEDQLSDLVKYSKIDTKKQGKNIVEQTQYKAGVDKLFGTEKIIPDNLFEDLTDYYKASYIMQKTNNAIMLFTDIMGSFAIEATAQFQLQVNEVARAIGESSPSADMLQRISRQILNYIRAGFFNKWAEDNHIDIKGLVDGDNTISDRLEQIRIKIFTDPEYSDMKSVDGSIKNYLLNQLVQGDYHDERIQRTLFNAGTRPSTHPHVKFIKTLNFMDADHVNEDDMAEAWDELLNDATHPEIQQFARDLIMYAFITSGGNSGNNLFKFIPNSWKLNSYGNDTAEDGYAQYMQDQLELYQNSETPINIDIDEIVLNNWHDDRFIPTIYDISDYKGYYTGRYYYDGNSAPEVSIPIMLIKQHGDIQGFEDDKYIKVRRDGASRYSTRGYIIYKQVAYTSDGRVIYAMVDPKGNKFGNNTLYEMRRSDASINESTAIMAYSKPFSMSMQVAKEAMGIQGNSIADILKNFINTIMDKENKVAIIDVYTSDPVLNELIRSAVGENLLSPEESAQMEQSNNTPKYYTGRVVPFKDTIFVFGSNPKGIHGAGAASVAKAQFGAIEGQGEGLQGESYALPTKDLDKARNTRWYRPGPQEEADVKAWYETHEYSEVVNHPLNSERTMTPQQIIEAIRRMYEVANQNPDKKFKVADYPLGKLSLNGYLGEEMLAMFKQAGPVPNNVYFTKEFVDNWNTIDTVAESRSEAEQAGTRTYRPGGETNSGYPLTDEFIQQIKDHIANDRLSVKNYQFDRIRKSLIKMVDALFDYLKDNNVQVTFVSADPNNQAGGRSMIGPSKDGNGWVIQIERNTNDTYLDIVHELLHITTSPFDNPVVKEFGMTDEMVKAVEKLNIYYQAFLKKAYSIEGMSAAYQALWDFRNKNISREEFNAKVPLELRELLHATEGVSEFVSMFVSSEPVHRTMTSIIYGERSLFDECVQWIKNFLEILFKGYSYVDGGNVLDDITEFLIKYKSTYQTPRQIIEPLYDIGDADLSSGSDILSVYQGYNSEQTDSRRYNYWTLDQKEAQQYGANVRRARVNINGFLHYYGSTGRQLAREFTKATGKVFDVLDNSKEGLQTQQEFFEFVESKGYNGITFVESDKQTDNLYVVSFGENGLQFQLNSIDTKGASEEVVQTAIDMSMQDESINRFNKYVMQPLNKELNDYLFGILNKFHFQVVIDDLKKLFGKDVLGAADYLQKVIYLSNGGDTNAITGVEEFAHIFVKMMGSAYHREGNRSGDFKATALYSEIRDLIEKTDFYKYVYSRYKDEYKYEDGTPNESLIKEEAIGQALAIVLYQKHIGDSDIRFKKIDDKSLINKIKEWFKAALHYINKNWFADKTEYVDKLSDELNKIADSILSGTYYEKYLDHVDDEGWFVQNYNDTIENSIKNGSSALNIMQAIVNNGGIITGSLSYRLQGTVYRSGIDSLHDIDTAFEQKVHKMNIKSFVTYIRGQVYTTDQILDIINKKYKTARKLINKLTKDIPNCHFMYAYVINNNHTLLLNMMSCEDPKLVERFMNMSGNFTDRLHKFSKEERDKMYLIDLFFNDLDYENTIEDDKYGLKLTDYTVSMDPKLKMSRAKDLYDYQRFNPKHRMFTKNNLMWELSEKQQKLGLDENNNQDPNKFQGERPYDVYSVSSQLNYLDTVVRKYLNEVYQVRRSIRLNGFTFKVFKPAVTGAKTVKLAIADTGGYVNDFSIKETSDAVEVTPRHTDQLQIDRLAALGKDFRENKCE